VKYRLPDALGGMELPEDTGGQLDSECGEYLLRFDIPDVGVVRVQRSALVEVKPPLPPEPPVGAYRVGGVLCMRVTPVSDKCWVYQTADGMFDEMTFAGLCSLFGSDVTRLVPDPFAEPVELPWSCLAQKFSSIGPAEVTVEKWPNYVRIVARPFGDGEWRLSPPRATAMARALWAASGQAESELPEWERDLLEGGAR